MLAFGDELLVTPDVNSDWLTPGGRELAAARQLPQAAAALRPELQRLADAVNKSSVTMPPSSIVLHAKTSRGGPASGQ